VVPRAPVGSGQQADVLVVGDSVGLNLAFGLARTKVSGSPLNTSSGARLGCPVARGGTFRFLRDIESFPDGCDWAATYPQMVDKFDPDVVLLVTGIWEVVDRRLPGDDRYRHLGNPVSDRYLLSELLSAVDVLAARGATVVLPTYPHVAAGQGQGFVDQPESEPARVDRLNQIFGEVAAARPGAVRLLELQSWLSSLPGGELDPTRRTDGVHFTDEASKDVARWLSPQLYTIAMQP
jgi:hypothetical protein